MLRHLGEVTSAYPEEKVLFRTNASLAQRQEFPTKKIICRYGFMDASRAANKRRFVIVAKFQKISDVYRKQEKKNAQKKKKMQ